MRQPRAVQGDAALEAQGVSWRCPDGRMAVRQASVRLRAGAIHALVGENGAGKSTLLKLMAGAMRPWEGRVLVGGVPLEPPTQAEAIRRGVGMVYQHFALVGSFTGLENMMLGAEPVGPLGWLRPAELRQKALAAAEQTGLRVPLDVPTERLSVGERQRLEILRVMVRGARVLLLDEPTAVLTPGEADGLYALLRRVAGGGAAVVVVTHHLDEVVKHADEVTVLRRGEQVHQGPTAEVTTATLAERALGVIARVDPPAAVDEGAPVVLEVEGLGAAGEGAALGPVSFRVRRGEVLGVAGIDGNGQEALVEALAGLRPASAGRVRLEKAELTQAGPGERRAAGLEVVHGDRHRFGLLAQASVHDNLVLGDLGWGDEAELGRRRLEESGVEPPDPLREAGSLSGGNQQKLVMARALDRAPRALVAAYPTRGIDAAAAALVQRRLVAAAEQGAAVVVVSGDWAELRAVAHRLVVLSKGRVVAELPSSATEAELGRAMLEGA